ncbi:FMN-binding protein [Eisenbergiella tayi]|uniref:FMN-binding protein n=1 Tax=Eisenbergiella tayi TaxID=1432052 RepID=UPI00114D2F8B|nr:FMN-binding protein [Eisenbergiella tayi]
MVNIEVIEHKTAYMAQAKQIAEAVCDEQSLKVDAISGATLTSDTVLKAIENALGKTESFE